MRKPKKPDLIKDALAAKAKAEDFMERGGTWLTFDDTRELLDHVGSLAARCTAANALIDAYALNTNHAERRALASKALVTDAAARHRSLNRFKRRRTGGLPDR